MKIGFVLDDSLDKTDGVQQYILSLGNWLNGQGHTVHYLVGETHRTDIPNLHSLSQNVNVRFNGNNMSIPLPANKKLIRSLLEKEKFDILHVQMPYNPFLARRIIGNSEPSTTAVIGTFHILPYGRFHRLATILLAKWLRGSLRRFDEVVAVSEPARLFANQYFIQTNTVLPCAIRVPSRRQTTDSNAREALRIVFLGRLVKRKGCLQLLKALSNVTARISTENMMVTIAGHGPELNKLRRYVRRHHLESLVTFAGYVSEEQKYNLLSAADIAVFPSISGESFGIVLLEAMAAGKGAIIAGNNPGYASVMDGHAQQLVDPRDIKGMADKLIHFINDDEARSSAYTWQRQHVGQFDINAVGPRLTTFYKQVLNDRQDMR